jgi:hypothetical protein
VDQAWLERVGMGTKITIFGFGREVPLYGVLPVELERIAFLTFSILVPTRLPHEKN